MSKTLLNRQDNETFEDYHLRLFENMHEYKIDKYIIADLLNIESGKNYDESKWRKDYSQYLRWKDYLIDKNLDKEILQKYEELKVESEKKKMQFQDQRREYRKYLRLDSRLDHILDTVSEEINLLNKTKPLEWFKKVVTEKSETDGVILISDWHRGLFTVNYWNKFDNDEFNRRVSELTNKIIEHGKFHGINTLHLFQMGDLIHGTIHRITRIVDTEDAIRSTMAVAETLSEMVSIFSKEFNEVKVYNARGNHERVSSNKSEEVSTESFNDIIPWFMTERLTNHKNVELVENEVDSEIIVADVLGNTVFAVHGHREKLGSVISDLTLMIKKFPKYIFSGHIHKNYENESHKIEHIVNSSLSGVDDFAKDIRKTSKAAQKFMIFTEKGRLCTYNIDLENE